MEARRLHASEMSKLKLVGNHVTDDWAIAFKQNGNSTISRSMTTLLKDYGCSHRDGPLKSGSAPRVRTAYRLGTEIAAWDE